MSSRHTNRALSKPSSKAMLMAIVIACTLAVAGLTACQPSTPAKSDGADAPAAAAQTQDNDAAKGASSESASTQASAEPSYPGDFRSDNQGFFGVEDNYYAENCINAGNRGCNSCHENLWDQVKDLSPIQHVLSSGPGYDQVYSITDCMTCHHLPSATGGPKMGEIVHNIHYRNEQFTDVQNGNCWTCHATDATGELVLYDYYKYTDQLGGYTDSGGEAMQNWLRLRTWNNSSVANVAIERDMKIDVTVDQRVSDEKDMFVANNYIVPELTADEYKLEITGTVNDRTFTLDELKSLPQTELTVTQGCNTNAIGSVMIGNFPVKGVLLEDVIEACGGLKDNTPSIKLVGYDEWGYNLSTDFLIEQGALLAYEYWGHELAKDQGYPVTLVIPGEIGAGWVKWLHTIEFNDGPQHGLANGMWSILETGAMRDIAQGDQTTSWLTPNRDGKEFKVGQPVDINGFAYIAANNGHAMTQIAFSADYGNTWTYVDVPENYDPRQWVWFEGTWTPETAGTHVLYVKAVDKKGSEQWRPDAIIVNVTE